MDYYYYYDQLGSYYSDQPDDPTTIPVTWNCIPAHDTQHILRMASGKLVNWDRTADLGRIAVPTLVVGARYDTRDPAHMQMMSKKIPKARYLFCATGSHMAMYDDQKTYMDGVSAFIKDVDAGRF